MRVTYRVKSISVRKMCIDYDYYTCGDCKAYDNMFSMCYEARTPEAIFNIAEDIWNHSDRDSLMDEWGEDDEAECVRMIANQIINDCSWADLRF